MSSLVLTYHRIASGRDPLQQCVRPERFAEQVACLRRLADIVPLATLDRPARGRRLALTFDDGYRDNAAVAAPILRDAAVPATFFVPSRLLDDAREYWWDRLEHAHLDAGPGPTGVDVAPGGRRVRIDVRTDAGRLRSLKVLNRRLRVLAQPELDAVVDDVERQLGAATREHCPTHALLDRSALVELAADPLFEIGSHGASHTMLSALTPAEQEAELRTSRIALEAAVGRPVTSFAYPFGTDGSYGDETVRTVRASGYERALVNVPARPQRRRRGYRLPRHMVYDWSGAELEQRVRGWFGSL